MKNIVKNKGFTLFEVLVALMILSITMVAAIVTTDNVIDRTVYLEKKLLSHFIGMNVLNNYQLNMSSKKTDPIRNAQGKITMRGQEFSWSLLSEKIDFHGAQLLALEVKVTESNNDKEILDTVNRLVPLNRI